MGRIDQMFCTHCTAETSVFGGYTGFSVRAGSLDPEGLRCVYQDIRDLTAYELPADLPFAEAASLDADTAPIRLVYLPRLGGRDVLGQVCYRPSADERAVGNYFGHFVFSGETSWTTLDAARLWGAEGWVRSDRPDFPHRLPPLDSLDDLFVYEPAAIDEELIRRFLIVPPGGPFQDPKGVIPERCRRQPAEERQALFAEVLDEFTRADLTRPGAIVLLAEPGLAALLFFGLARFGPEAIVTDPISFSTYESGPSLTTLSATLVRDDLHRGPREGFLRDTFKPPKSGTPGGYAKGIVSALVEGAGWAEVDRFRADSCRNS